jgi:hypothetical protein
VAGIEEARRPALGRRFAFERSLRAGHFESALLERRGDAGKVRGSARAFELLVRPVV